MIAFDDLVGSGSGWSQFGVSIAVLRAATKCLEATTACHNERILCLRSAARRICATYLLCLAMLSIYSIIPNVSILQQAIVKDTPSRKDRKGRNRRPRSDCRMD